MVSEALGPFTQRENFQAWCGFLRLLSAIDKEQDSTWLVRHGGHLHKGKNFQAELKLGVGYLVYSWPSWDEYNVCLAWLSSRVRLNAARILLYVVSCLKYSNQMMHLK